MKLEEIDLNKAISMLTKIYEGAKKNNRINKPVAYSLYHTWQNINALEKARKGRT